MKKTIISFCALFAFAGSAFATDSFSVDNITLPQNSEADVVVRFSLDEGSTCSGYTFWLQVPEDLAFVMNDAGTRPIYTVGNCYEDNPTITPNIDAGYLKVGCLTANSDPIIGQTGILVTFRIKAVGSVNVGDTFEGTLTKGTISSEGGDVHDVANTSFTITISEPVDPRIKLDETSTTVPEAATDVDVRVLRTIKADEWSTLVLPFNMTEAQVKTAFGDDVQLAEFIEYEANDDLTAISVIFDNANLAVDGLMANNPYIIKTSQNITEFTVDGVTIDPDEAVAEYTNGKSGSRKVVYGSFIGTYQAQTVVPANSLFLSGNNFWYSAGLTKMKAFRAYFTFQDVLASVDNAGARISLTIGSESAGISYVKNLDEADGYYYNLQGQRISHPSRGIYILNGKKTAVK